MENTDSGMLSITQINESLGKCSGWGIEDNGKSIRRIFQLGSFKEAVDFINKVAGIAENEEHYPDIRLHSPDLIEIKLTTHKIDCLTQKDFDVAIMIDGL
ncbi:MAG: 4a-hydroxytetrahydrobiopterin dehydratase [Nanoarchaeota archaeon]|nr:4a-hydroxytetrahydrobiopterin dehydratase [Nanoarchaeota archaeon]